ncbi:MAG: sterol desaturase family protein [Bacteroidota bacterium]|nr:sterol desaturase family protein [Bacteroidota bacterium]
MKIIRRVFDHKGAPLVAAIFVVLFIAEGRRQLRKRQQPRWQRVIINSVVAVPAFTLLRFVFLPVMVKLAKKNKQLHWGFNYQYKAHSFIKGAAAFLIMDYSNYLWHILNHKIPLLWRFHLVHHTDRDLDVTTAIRFHFGEMIGSVFFRGLFVFLSGATPLNVLMYEILLESATQFHHSNWNLPYQLEKDLNKIIVTPRMHGIHHSEIRQERNSNYSVIFSFWDRLHHTARLNVAQNTIVTGISTYNNPDELTIGYLLKLPFTKIRTK